MACQRRTRRTSQPYQQCHDSCITENQQFCNAMPALQHVRLPTSTWECHWTTASKRARSRSWEDSALTQVANGARPQAGQSGVRTTGQGYLLCPPVSTAQGGRTVASPVAGSSVCRRSLASSDDWPAARSVRKAERPRRTASLHVLLAIQCSRDLGTLIALSPKGERFAIHAVCPKQSRASSLTNSMAVNGDSQIGISSLISLPI